MMTSILLIVALSSTLLGVLCWLLLCLFRGRPQGQSTLLVTAAVMLIGLPVVAVIHHKGSAGVELDGGVAEFVGVEMEEFVVPNDADASAVTVVAETNLSDREKSEANVIAANGGQVESSDRVSAVRSSLIHEGGERNVLPVEPFTQVDSAGADVVASVKPFKIQIPDRLGRVLACLWLIWIAGALVTGLRFVVQCVCFQKEAGKHKEIQDPALNAEIRLLADEMGLPVSRIPQLVCSDEASPYCYGIVRRRLHLPVSLLETSGQEELTMILRHELQHVRQHDLALLVLQLPVRVFYWWNPLVTGLMKRLDLVRETMCDRAASEGAPERYAHLLLQFASSPEPSHPTVMAMASSAKTMHTRIRSLYSPEKKDLKTTGLLCGLCVSGALAFLLTNVQVASAVDIEEKSNEEALAAELTASDTIHRILYADAGQRTRTAAELQWPNNPVEKKFTKYLKAREVAKSLMSRGYGPNHPAVAKHQRLANEHLRQADQAVFDLLLLLQKSAGESEVNPAEQKPLPDDQAIDVEDPRVFYPHYLRKLRSLPAAKQFEYATSLPITNNPALLHAMERQVLKNDLEYALSRGLGFKHPDILGVQQRLEIYDTRYAEAALRLTIDLLENNDREPPTQTIIELFVERRNVSQCRVEGLGPKHPEIIMREAHIEELEQKIHDWNNKENDQNSSDDE